MFEVLVCWVLLTKWAVSFFCSFHKISRDCNTIWKSGVSYYVDLVLASNYLLNYNTKMKKSKKKQNLELVIKVKQINALNVSCRLKIIIF